MNLDRYLRIALALCFYALSRRTGSVFVTERRRNRCEADEEQANTSLWRKFVRRLFTREGAVSSSSPKDRERRRSDREQKELEERKTTTTIYTGRPILPVGVPRPTSISLLLQFFPPFSLSLYIYIYFQSLFFSHSLLHFLFRIFKHDGIFSFALLLVLPLTLIASNEMREQRASRQKRGRKKREKSTTTERVKKERRYAHTVTETHTRRDVTSTRRSRKQHTILNVADVFNSANLFQQTCCCCCCAFVRWVGCTRPGSSRASKCLLQSPFSVPSILSSCCESSRLSAHPICTLLYPMSASKIYIREWWRMMQLQKKEETLRVKEMRLLFFFFFSFS